MDALAPGTVIAGRYTVVGTLGQGGMAVVYEVTNQQLRTSAALKVLTITARSVRDRLVREGQVQSGLSHPNVLSVFDVVDVDGAPGLLMELVRGPSLDHLLAEQRLTFDQCDALARGIFAGMESAHERGLIHRDLKPANILCAIANGQLIPKIADFGLAKIVNDAAGGGMASATKSGTTMGTPSYMAPEQIRNAGKVDQRADIFSLGAILYELVCGRKAFEGDDLLDLFTAVAAGRYTPPRELRPDLPTRMERAIVGALLPDRDQRIRDVATLAAVWSGDRDEWTMEFDPRAVAVPAGPWDPSLLSKWSSNQSGGSSGGGRTTPVGSPASGVTYTEDVEHPAAAVVATLPPSRRSLAPYAAPAALAIAFVGALGVAGLGVMGAAAWFAWRSTDVAAAPLPPVPDVPEVPAVVGALPAPDPVVPAAPEPAAPEPLATTAPPDRPTRVAVAEVSAPRPATPALATPAPAPLPEPPAPDAVPAPVPVVTGPTHPGWIAVDVAGDARKVYLQGSDGNHALPGEVPPGDYRILAWFPGDDAPVQAGTLVVAAGSSPSVRCRASLRSCK